MRISTSMMHQTTLDSLQRQQQALLRTQTQLASQQRLASAADDPADWSSGMNLDRVIAQNTRYLDNAGHLGHRLGLEENALADANDVLSRVRELALQANAATQSPQSRDAIVQELDALREQMLGIANRDDGSGRYLFAGSRDGSTPFAWSGSHALYNGDETVRQLPIGASRSLAEADAGSDVFMRLPTGNGRFAVAADAANTGTLSLQNSVLLDAAAFAGDSYALNFNAGQYELRDGGGTLVASGAYTPGSAIQAQGMQLRFDGEPADGDRFTIEPSRSQDVLALIDKFARLVEGPQDTAGGRGAFHTGMQQGLAEVEAAQAHFLSMRSSVGVRLSAAEDAAASLQAAQVEAQTALSAVRDLDVAEAASRLQLQLVSLQAAQSSFVQVQGLTLFDYLR